MAGVPEDTATLVQVVQAFVDWANQTMVMVSQLQRKRQASWAEYVEQPFNHEHTVSGMEYRFGCPTVNEEPDGLQDALAHAKSVLSTADNTTLTVPTRRDDGSSNPHTSAVSVNPSSSINPVNTTSTGDIPATSNSDSTPSVLDTLASIAPDPVPKKTAKHKAPPSRDENHQRVSARLSASHNSNESLPRTTRSTTAKAKGAATRASAKTNGATGTKHTKK
ncbi:hypothetical protein OPQ81_011098 [Rhizoctonia solani]|nr:hypothetical protein OPQ81_011098 [Rhizoctonia solani]